MPLMRGPGKNTISRYGFIAVLVSTLFLADRHSASAASDRLEAWQTCSLTEGKGDSCRHGDQPRRFEEFLAPGPWAQTTGDSFSGEFQWDLQQPENRKLKVTWREIGRLRVHRVRAVHYSAGGSGFADLILAEGSPGIFSPLMKWSGQMPEPKVYESDGTQVLVIQKDFGGNIPMVMTWAWIWGPNGPIRLDVEGAMSQAIQKVAPEFGGYNTGLNWQTLHGQTWVWKGDYPGKTGVGATVEAWFQLGPDGLAVRSAEFRNEFAGDPGTIRWPRARLNSDPDPVVQPSPARVLAQQIVVEFKDLHGQPIPGLEVRVKDATSSAATDIEGMATIRFPSAMPDGGAVAVELVHPAKPLVAISPCGAVVAIAQSTRTLVLAERGDPELLSSPLALASLTDCILRMAPPLEKYQPAEYPRRRRQSLVSISRSIGVTPASLDRAIRAWARKTTDPIEQGLGALYEERPRDALDRLLHALHIPEVQPLVTARVPTSTEDRVAAAEFYRGRALFAERRFAESAAAYERAAAIWHDDSAVLESWGFSMSALWDYAGAEVQLRRALSINEAVSGKASEIVFASLNNLAALLYVKADYAAIEALERRSLAIAETISGPASADYAEALHNLAVLSDARLDYPSAEALYHQALDIRKNTLGPQHLETAETMEKLGVLLYHQHSIQEAVPLLRSALQIREKALGPAHPALARSVNAMGLCAEEEGDLGAAEQLYRRAIDMNQSLIGKDDIDTAAYLGNLASLLVTRARLDEAEPLQRQALAMEEAILGPNHPDLIDSLQKLAYVLNARGHQYQAEPLLYRALAIREKTSGPDHPDVGSLLNDLSAVLLNEGKDAEAEPLLRRALAIQEKSVGPDHVDTARSLNDLARLLDRKGDFAAAVSLFERALAIREKALGRDHPDTRSTREWLLSVQQKMAQAK